MTGFQILNSLSQTVDLVRHGGCSAVRSGDGVSLLEARDRQRMGAVKGEREAAEERPKHSSLEQRSQISNGQSIEALAYREPKVHIFVFFIFHLSICLFIFLDIDLVHFHF